MTVRLSMLYNAPMLNIRHYFDILIQTTTTKKTQQMMWGVQMSQNLDVMMSPMRILVY